ncbi:MAG TPA: signal peptide peptidase SppA [Syntrophomonas sp.]|nr:signal peptide peptidase SppA [Syntrophomonas sp.]
MKKRIVIGLILVFLLILLIMAVQSISQPQAGLKSIGKIGVIEVSGTITGTSTSNLLQGTTASARDIMAIIRQAAARQDIKAVVLRVDSPGGTSVASQEIGVELDKLRATGKPVITSMGDVCASGGYWIACSTDHIMANPATLTGSIGVIMQMQNIEGLYEKLGVKEVVIKSGQHKDIGSPFRDLSPEEQQILQGIVQDSYQQFIDQVVKGREGKITREQLMPLADGRIFTGAQARDLGLVDSLGDYYDAIEQAKVMAGIQGEVPIEVLNQQDMWKRLVTSLESTFLGNQPTTRLYY